MPKTIFNDLDTFSASMEDFRSSQRDWAWFDAMCLLQGLRPELKPAGKRWITRIVRRLGAVA